jgi:preprotein translocase subunit SecG
MLFTFLSVVQGIIAAALVGIILMQRSEGGGLGMGGGGSPGGLMSARGAADFMTRTTAILAFLFVLLSVVLAVIAAGTTGATREIEDAFQRDDATPAAVPAPSDPLSGAGATNEAAPAPAGQAAPAQQAPSGTDPLSGAAQ